jgi:hypothetical protein
VKLFFIPGRCYVEVVVTGLRFGGENVMVEFTSVYGRGWAVDWGVLPGGIKVEVGRSYCVQFHMFDVLVFGKTIELSEKRETEFEIEGEVYRAVACVEGVQENGIVDVRLDESIQMLELEDASMLKAGDWVRFEGRALVLYPWDQGA